MHIRRIGLGKVWIKGHYSTGVIGTTRQRTGTMDGRNECQIFILTRYKIHQVGTI